MPLSNIVTQNDHLFEQKVYGINTVYRISFTAPKVEKKK